MNYLIKKQNKNSSAFTIVELIIVVVILAILATISFLTFNSYTKEARDSKRLTDISSLYRKINIKLASGYNIKDLIIEDPLYSPHQVTINGYIEEARQGIINFNNLGESQKNFQDPTNNHDYLFAYSLDNNNGINFKFFQLATVSEIKNATILFGNYYKFRSGDSKSLFIVDSFGQEVELENLQLPLAYELKDTETRLKCGYSANNNLENKPENGLCLNGKPSEVTGNGPWEWVCSGNDDKKINCRTNSFCGKYILGNGIFNIGQPTLINQEWQIDDEDKPCYVRCDDDYEWSYSLNKCISKPFDFGSNGTSSSSVGSFYGGYGPVGNIFLRPSSKLYVPNILPDGVGYYIQYVFPDSSTNNHEITKFILETSNPTQNHGRINSYKIEYLNDSNTWVDLGITNYPNTYEILSNGWGYRIEYNFPENTIGKGVRFTINSGTQYSGRLLQLIYGAVFVR